MHNENHQDKIKDDLVNPAPSCVVLDPAGRLSWAIHPALFYSARVHPRSRAAGFSGRCWIKCLLYYVLINTTADFFRHSRENGNPACLCASKPQLDTRFRGYDGWGGNTFCCYSAVLFQRVAVVLKYS